MRLAEPKEFLAVSLMRHTDMRPSPALREALYRTSRSGSNDTQETTPSVCKTTRVNVAAGGVATPFETTRQARANADKLKTTLRRVD